MWWISIRPWEKEALEVMRGVLPGDSFGRAYAAVQRRISNRREMRRRARALDAVTDPEKAEPHLTPFHISHAPL